MLRVGGPKHASVKPAIECSLADGELLPMLWHMIAQMRRTGNLSAMHSAWAMKASGSAAIRLSGNACNEAGFPVY
jgi:hypothetical protein